MPFAYEILQDVTSDSLRIQTEKKTLRVDNDQHESELTHLNIHGTPEAFRWLSQLLNELATTAGKTDDPQIGHSVTYRSHETKQISMPQWWGLELYCRRELGETQEPS